MNNLVFLEGALCAETLSTLLTNERPIANVNGTHMCLHIDSFAESFITVLAWMQQFLLIRQMHEFVTLHFDLCGKSFRTFRTGIWKLNVGMLRFHMRIELTLDGERFIARGASVNM